MAKCLVSSLDSIIAYVKGKKYRPLHAYTGYTGSILSKYLSSPTASELEAVAPAPAGKHDKINDVCTRCLLPQGCGLRLLWSEYLVKMAQRLGQIRIATSRGSVS